MSEWLKHSILQGVAVGMLRNIIKSTINSFYKYLTKAQANQTIAWGS